VDIVIRRYVVELSPVTHYREPGYPTRDILRDQPELLRTAPVRWQRNAMLASVLATSLTLVLPAWAGEEGAGPSVDTPVPVEQPLVNIDHEPMLMGMISRPADPTTSISAILTISLADRAIRDGNIVTAPVRLVAQHLGAQVSYDGQTSTTTITRGETTLVLTRGRVARVNGNPVTLPARARYRRSGLYAPIRFLVEHLGGQVQWNEKTDEIQIVSAAKWTLLLKVRHPQAQVPSPESPAVTLDQRREALRDYVAWLKAQEMI